MSVISDRALECFKQSIEEIMLESGFHNLSIETEKTETNYALLTTVGFTGRVHGYLMLQSDMTSANSFVQTLAEYVGMEINHEEFGDFHRSTFCEIVNQICGRSTIHLSNIDLDSDITPPSIIIGDSVSSSISDFDVAETYYVSDDFGHFKIFLGINIS